MFRVHTAAVLCMLLVQASYAAETRMNLLNPDGSPAVDARVLVVKELSVLARVVVDTSQISMTIPNGESQEPLVGMLENDGGTVTFDDSAKAIVAASESGFVFIPSEALQEDVKLHPWARIQIDTESLPPELSESYRLRISWTNCFAGRYSRTWKSGPFEPAPASGKTVSKPDWRFDRYITIEQTIDVTNDVVRVPPGEVTLTLFKSPPGTDPRPTAKTEQPPASNFGIGILRVAGGTTTPLSFPKFGAVEGTISQDTQGLPRWGKPDGERSIMRAEAGGRSEGISSAFGSDLDQLNQRTMRDSPSERDRIAQILASDEGFRLRSRGTFSASTAVSESGAFRFDFLPEGTYRLTRLVGGKARKDPSGHTYFSYRPTPLVVLDGKSPMESRVTVKADEVTKLRLATPAGFAQQPAERQLGVLAPAAGPQPTRTVIESKRVVRDGKEVTVLVPRVVNPPGRRSSGAAAPEPNGRLFSETPGTVPTPPATAQPVADPGEKAAIQLIESWIGEEGRDADRSELKELLREHLRGEFEAAQRSRRNEIDRLQKLIDRSKDWLEGRRERRDKIVDERIEELLKRVDNARKAGPPARSSARP